MACPLHIIVDFDKTASNAFMEYFPGTTIKVCFFHLSKNLWRKVHEFGLQSSYQQDSVIALKFRMLPALPFLLHRYTGIIYRIIHGTPT